MVGEANISRQATWPALDVSAGGNGRLRTANARSTRKSETAPRKNGSARCAAAQATMSEQKHRTDTPKEIQQAHRAAARRRTDLRNQQIVCRNDEAESQTIDSDRSDTEHDRSRQKSAEPPAINRRPSRNDGRNPSRESRIPDNCTPTSDDRNWTKKRLPACVSFRVHRAISTGSIGPSNVVRTPVGKNASCAARTSRRLEEARDESLETVGMQLGFRRETEGSE